MCCPNSLPRPATTFQPSAAALQLEQQIFGDMFQAQRQERQQVETTSTTAKTTSPKSQRKTTQKSKSPVLHPRVIVEHNYHDHARDAPALPLHNQEPIQGHHNSHPYTFPMKLFHMLQSVSDDGFGNVVSWQPHGRCFVIHQMKEFKELLPRYFNLSKIASFQRQLNLYGFQRLTQGRDKGGYYHELFLQGREHLVPQIPRIKVKGTGVRGKSNPEQEPNFWGMEWVSSTTTTTPPLPASSLVSRSEELPTPTTLMSEDCCNSQQTPEQQEEDDEMFSLLLAEDNDAATSIAVAPTPIKSFAPLEQSIASLFFPEQQEQQQAETVLPTVTSSYNDDDSLLMEFGKAFFALDVLPQDLTKPTTLAVNNDNKLDLQDALEPKPFEYGVPPQSIVSL